MQAFFQRIVSAAWYVREVWAGEELLQNEPFGPISGVNCTIWTRHGTIGALNRKEFLSYTVLQSSDGP